MKRRRFLQYASLFGASSVIAVGSHGCVLKTASSPGAAHSFPTAGSSTPRLVVVFLRGAADGLNIVIPHQDAAYYDARPQVAIAPPKETNGALDLDGYFGLHPALIDLLPQWQSGHLAFVHSAGLPKPVRSHFEAQDYMEIGVPESRAFSDGWMNRLLSVLGGAEANANPTQAVNFNSLTPLMALGAEPVASISVGQKGLHSAAVDYQALGAAFDRLYSGTDPLSQVYQSARAARSLLREELDDQWFQSVPEASTIHEFSRSAHALAQLMVGDAQTQLAILELQGWDTHVNQAFRLNQQLTILNDGLAILIEKLGDVYTDTTIVVMSEFGRTVAENGNRGTEHGHGNVMGLLGGAIQGQRMYGTWTSLAETNLNEGRDLGVTTDFREVLSSILGQQWGLNPQQLAQVFPNYQAEATLPFFG